jgi:hypothetical protein
MTFFFTDIPRRVAREDYARANELLIGHLRQLPGLASIIGFGTVSSPGISDIDLLAVFEDGCDATFNARDVLPAEYGYLVTHNVAAMSRSHYLESPRFTAWHRQESLWGENLAAAYHCSWSPAEEQALRVQTAVEFLITNYVDMAIQQTYGIIKLRSTLQHLKALKFDLEFLAIDSGPVCDKVNELRGWIDRWFDLTPRERSIGGWLAQFFSDYESFTAAALRENPLYLPRRPVYQLSANARLLAGPSVSRHHSGLVLPSAFGALGRRFFNLQHRLNRFAFTAPMVHSHPVALIEERYRFFARVREYHRLHFGQFITLTPTLPARVA